MALKKSFLLATFLFITVAKADEEVIDLDEEIVVEEEIVVKSPLQLPKFPDDAAVHFFESFQGDSLEALGWVKSSADEYASQVVSIESVESAYEGDKALLLGKKHVRYGVSKKLAKPLSMTEDTIVLQFETRSLERISCSGAYIKFISEDADGDQSLFSESTDYVVMFGPDKCGTTPKIHAIFKHKNPVSGELEEKHMAQIKQPDIDRVSHVYTLIINNIDQTVKVFVDQAEKGSSVAIEAEGFSPSFLPPLEIDDPEDFKPDDWVDKEKIKDPDAVKPEDWVDIEFIVDPESSKPDDWDDEEDGEWEPAQIENPEYKGKWKAPKIDNPDYKGPWSARRIPNPHFFEQDKPLSTLPKISHVFLEVLANDEGISFDNILITTNEANAKVLAEEQGLEKQKIERELIKVLETKKSKEERDRKLNEEFGVTAVLEYIVGEAKDLYEKYPTEILGGSIVVVGLLVFLCVFRSSSPNTEEKEAEAAKKKDDDIDDKKEEAGSEDEKEDKAEAAGEEEEKKSSVRRRPRKAD